jgi:hypothetical protein
MVNNYERGFLKTMKKLKRMRIEELISRRLGGKMKKTLRS